MNLIIALLAGIGACTVFVLACISGMLVFFAILDAIRARPKKVKTVEELKVKWERVPARRH